MGLSHLYPSQVSPKRSGKSLAFPDFSSVLDEFQSDLQHRTSELPPGRPTESEPNRREKEPEWAFRCFYLLNLPKKRGTCPEGPKIQKIKSRQAILKKSSFQHGMTFSIENVFFFNLSPSLAADKQGPGLEFPIENEFFQAKNEFFKRELFFLCMGECFSSVPVKTNFFDLWALCQEDVNGEKLTVKKWWIFGADFFTVWCRFFHGLRRFFTVYKGHKL